MAKELRRLSGLDISLDEDDLSIDFGQGISHPSEESRYLPDVRSTLEDPSAHGPEHLYNIWMDIYRQGDEDALRSQELLYGAMVFNYGAIGRECLRSQGHIHTEKPGTGMRYSEVFEFWTGSGFVYLQKECSPEVTRAFLVHVKPGDKLVLPFGWVHLVGSNSDEVLSFGAWCARENGFEYENLRRLRGPAHYIYVDGSVGINPRYDSVPELEHVTPTDLPSLRISQNVPIYQAWKEEPELFEFLGSPEAIENPWKHL